MRRLLLTSLLLPVGGTLAFAAALLATHREASKPGQTAKLGNGTIRTFVTLDSAGHPAAVGVVFTAGLLTGLPDTNAPFTLTLGPDGPKTPFTHLYFDWVPLGHAPGGIYDRPHLDFHFYLVSIEDREAVAGGVDSVPPPSRSLPRDYAKVTESVAFMGTHFADMRAPEFHGMPFEKTLLYGSHEGKITFYDLMTTVEWLKTRPRVAFPIKQPLVYPGSGYFPTQVQLTYDSSTATYRVALERFVSH